MHFLLASLIVAEAMVIISPTPKKKVQGRAVNTVDKSALWERLKPFASSGADFITMEQLSKAYTTPDKYGALIALPPIKLVEKQINSDGDDKLTKKEANDWEGYTDGEFCKSTGDRSYGCLDRCLAGTDRVNGFPGYFEDYKMEHIPGLEMSLDSVGKPSKTYNGQMTPAQEAAITTALHHQINSKVAGHVAALGLRNTPVWRLLYTAIKDTDKRGVYLFDSFTGAAQCDHKHDTGMCPAVGTSKINEDMLKGDINTWNSPTGKEQALRKERITVHKDYTKKDLPSKIAFAIVDGSIYPTMKAMLDSVYPHLSKGGLIAVHDFGWEGYPGVEAAVKEFTTSNEGLEVVLPGSLDGVPCYLGFIRKTA